MSRYIDADLIPFRRDYSRFVATEDDVDSVPTADVVEVRHGEWLKSNPYNRFMNCSVCGFGQNHTNFPYCPNCGAKMDGDRREE